MSTNELVSYLKSHRTNTSFINHLKIVYRPYVCPFDELIYYVDNGDIVYDIGCGSGQFVRLLAEFSYPKKIIGIDIDQKLIMNAASLHKHSNIETSFEEYDGINLPTNISDADKIFVIDVLHHIPKKNQAVFLESLYGLMKSGAELILKDINRDSLLVWFNKIHVAIFSGEIGHELSYSKVIDQLIDIGFTIKLSKKQNRYVYPHYTIIAKK